MAINRAQQNWPTDTTNTLPEQPKPLNPYMHTCSEPEGAGHTPADCPACTWVEQGFLGS